MTLYTFDLGAGGIRTLALDGKDCRLDNEPVTQLEALRFLQDATNKGLMPTITQDPTHPTKETPAP